jgi:hypothetical protein
METRIAFLGSGIMAEVMIRDLLTHESAKASACRMVSEARER